MALEGAQLLAAGPLPDLHRLVLTARGQPRSIRTECDIIDPTGMALEGAQVRVAEAILVIPFPAAPVLLAGTRLAVKIQQLQDCPDVRRLPGTLGHVHAGGIEKSV